MHRLHLSRDPYLKPLLDSIELPALVHERSLYLDLLESIVSQQLSVRVADVIFGRFLGLFEGGFPTPEVLVATETDVLRTVGLSAQKAGYLRNVARFALEHGLETDQLHLMTDEEIVAYLTRIKGVGKWTAEMILMSSLNRPDVFPVDDLGIQQAMIRLYGLEEKGRLLRTRMLEIAESWRPYRTYASRYLWRWKDAKPLIRKDGE
jgi:DNA-3-methyladenine glycosylase II